MSASERIDTAGPEIPHTPQQAARAHAGQRAHFGGQVKPSDAVLAARRVVSFLLTTESALIAFDRESKKMVVRSVLGADSPWEAGDILIDYKECVAIKELLDRVEDGA